MPPPNLAESSAVAAPPARLSAARLLLEHLKGEGVDAVFGIPGGPATPLFDALYHEPALRTIAARHEAGAAFMAAGYARLSGRPGVCVLTTGPGTTNAVTAVAAAKADSLPVLVLSAQVATTAFGKGSLQDSTWDRADTVAMLSPVTKMSAMLANPANMGTMLRQALRLAMTGRRGPVHLNIPTDLMKREVAYDLQRPDQYRPMSRVFDREAVKEAAERLLAAKSPAILAGHGVYLAGAQPELLELAELLSIPVATTPKGKGVFPETHPLSLRVFGLASSPLAEEYLLRSGVDVLMVLGSSLHENSTQGWDPALRPGSAFIQQDIEPSVIGRNYPVTVGLVGDAKTTLRELVFQIKRLLARGEHPVASDPALFASWRSGRSPVSDTAACASVCVPLKPQRIMRELDSALPEDAAVFLDVGSHTLWALHYLTAKEQQVFCHNWGEFAAMGSGVAGAVGAKLAAPSRPVVAIVGDGGFGMAGMEVVTAATYGVPVVWVVFNDGRYNAVHHGQTLQYEGRTIGTEFKRMDLAAAAKALGAQGFIVRKPGEVGPALRRALDCGSPAVIDVRLDADEPPPLGARIKSLDKAFLGEGSWRF